jgi:hypothetical protein
MTPDLLRNSGVSDLFADLSDLAQKELRLARAEVSAKISSRVHGGIWMAIAGGLGLIVLLLVIAAAVLWLASFADIELHWACLLVALVLAAAGAIAFLYARSVMREELLPTRTARQIATDMRTAKEQLT